jgi:hypothetical protein
MDIMIHIGMLLIIGLFFFLDKYSKTNNAMFVVILLTFFGFIFILGDSSVDIIDYTSKNITTNMGVTIEQYERVDVTSLGVGIFNVQIMLVLMYFFFLIVAVTNFMYDNNKYGK